MSAHVKKSTEQSAQSTAPI